MYKGLSDKDPTYLKHDLVPVTSLPGKLNKSG